MRVIATLIDLYSLIVLAAVVVSWVQLAPTHPLRSTLDSLTEPVLAPIRRVLPPVGGLDLSPLVLLFALQLLGRVLF
jgi:YggT family protein